MVVVDLTKTPHFTVPAPAYVHQYVPSGDPVHVVIDVEKLPCFTCNCYNCICSLDSGRFVRGGQSKKRKRSQRVNLDDAREYIEGPKMPKVDKVKCTNPRIHWEWHGIGALCPLCEDIESEPM